MSFKYWQSALDNRLHAVEESLNKDGIEPPPRLARMQFELEARAMRTMLSQVHQKLNKLSLASNLPDSALQRIFLILSVLEPVPNATWTTRTRESCHWTKVLDVCRSYRTAGLACPQLWASPPLSLGSARFHAFMGRSRDLPINLHLADAGDLCATLLCDALQEPEDLVRIRCLESSVPLAEDALQALTGSAPLLETLRVCPPEILQKESEMVMPDHILGGEAPRLRVLELRGFSTFFIQTSIVSHVVSLTLSRGVDEDAYTRPSRQALRTLLESLVSIEELILHGCLPKPSRSDVAEALEDDNAASKPPRVDLLRLRRLNVGGKAEPITWLFRNVFLQPACTLQVQIRDRASTMNELTDALAASGILTSHGDSERVFRSMRILTRAGEEDRPILHVGLFDGTDVTSEPCPFVIEVEHLSRLRTLEVYENLQLPTQALHTLYLGAGVVTSSEQILLRRRVPRIGPGENDKLLTFFDCKQLKTLHTDGPSAKGLIKALEHPALFPALQSLVIARGLNFEEDYKEELMITWKVFQRTLTTRKDVGCPIQSVGLPPETLKEYWVERMKETGVTFAVADVEGPEGHDSFWSRFMTMAEDVIPREY